MVAVHLWSAFPNILPETSFRSDSHSTFTDESEIFPNGCVWCGLMSMLIFTESLGLSIVRLKCYRFAFFFFENPRSLVILSGG